MRTLTRGRGAGLHRTPGRCRQRDHDPPHRLGRQCCSPNTPSSARTWPSNPSSSRTPWRRCLRYEPPSPIQARYVTARRRAHGQTVPAGSVMVLINAVGQPRRASVRRPRPLRHPPQDPAPPELRLRPPFLPRRAPGPARGPGSRSRRSSSGSPSGRSTTPTPCRPGPPRCGAGRSSRSSSPRAPDLASGHTAR